MKSILTIAGLIILAASTSMAQQRVILESAGTNTAFGGASAFIDAYNAASDGDTLYLPGLQFSAPNPFDKSLAIIGAGYHPDHTEATGVTRLSGTINIRAGATGSHFEGIYFNNGISFAAAKIDDVTFKRCYFSGDITLNGLDEEPSNNIGILECVIRGRFNGQRTSSLQFRNNVLINNTYDIFQNIRNNALIANNIIVGRGSQQWNAWPYDRYVIRSITESSFANNIIYNTERTSHTFTGVNNNTFENNVFSYNPTGDANNTWNNNYTGVSITGMFVNYTGNSFSFEADYNLVDPASYQGTTGNQVGIYGGLSPFKENTRPSNPQITSANIGQGTDETGMLHIDIEVEAQEQ